MKNNIITITLLFLLIGCHSSDKKINTKVTIQKNNVVVADGNTISVEYEVRPKNIWQSQFDEYRKKEESLQLSTRQNTVSKNIKSTFAALYNNVGFGALTGLRYYPELHYEPIELEQINLTYTYPNLILLTQNKVKYSDVGSKIILSPQIWQLKNDGVINNHYTLTYGILLYAEKKFGTFTCQKEQGGYTLEEWQKNQYDLTIKTTKQLADQCLQDGYRYFSLNPS